MKISVVIPAGNSEQVLGRCLDALLDSEHAPFEIIVIDCGSDTTAYRQVVAPYPVHLMEDDVAGKGEGRTLGIEAATGDIVVLVDADIVVARDSLSRVVDGFERHPDVDIINGILSKQCPHDDFFSQYKSLYMNFRFKQIPEDIDFLFTSFTAFRHDTVVVFKDTIKPKDTETGQNLAKRQGRRILLDRELEVVHLKNYTFASILRNDFIVPYGWAKIFWSFRGLKDVASKGRFAHASADQIASVVVVSLGSFAAVVALAWPIALGAALLGALAFLALNRRFFSFIRRERGSAYMLGSIAFTYLDTLVMGTAIAVGFAETALRALLRQASPAVAATPSQAEPGSENR